MDPNTVAVIGIISGASVAIAGFLFDFLFRERDRRQRRADDRTERAIGIYTNALNVVMTLDPTDLYSFKNWDTDELLNRFAELGDELEWLTMMGWTPSIWKHTDALHTSMNQLVAKYLDFMPAEGKEVEGAREALMGAVKRAKQDVEDLRQAVWRAIKR